MDLLEMWKKYIEMIYAIVGIVGWRRGVVLITKFELMFCSGSNSACGVLEICNGENLQYLSQLQIRYNTFCRSTIPENQFIVNTCPSIKWINQLLKQGVFPLIFRKLQNNKMS